MPDVHVDVSNRMDEVPERFVPDTTRGELIEAEQLARYWWSAGIAEGRRVLDAGCGLGHGTNLLAASGAVETVGVDSAAAVLEAAVGGAAEGARFVTAGIHDMPFEDGSFDLIVCFEVLERLDRAQEAITELARVLSPGGVLAISWPNRDASVPGGPNNVAGLYSEELEKVLAGHFPYTAVRQQQNLIASAVLEGGVGASLAVEPIARAELAQVVSATDDGAPYSIVLASRQPLPSIPVRMVATGLAEVRRWLELYQKQQDLLMAQKALFEEQRTTGAELDELHVQLRRSEEEVGRLVDLVESERALYADRVAEVTSSLSWRVTVPLRRVKRLLAR